MQDPGPNSYLQTILDSQDKYKFNDQEELRQYIAKAQNGDKEAMDRVIYGNARLIVYCMKPFIPSCKSMTREDLFNEGVIGMMQAVKMFDFDMDCKFSTYAVFWIRQSIMRAIQNGDSLVRLPVHAHEKLYKILTAQAEYVDKHHIMPSTKDLAKMTGIEENVILTITEAPHALVSLNAVTGSNEDSEKDELLNFVPDENNLIDKSICQMDYSLFETEIAKVLAQKQFTDRDINIIKERFGLTTKMPKELRTIGDKYGITGERVRQIELRAIRAMKNSPTLKQHAESLIAR